MIIRPQRDQHMLYRRQQRDGPDDQRQGTYNSAKRNMVLSKERAEHVAQALVDAGIAADRISTNYYGDTKQVSEVAEENRVSICVTR